MLLFFRCASFTSCSVSRVKPRRLYNPVSSSVSDRLRISSSSALTLGDITVYAITSSRSPSLISVVETSIGKMVPFFLAMKGFKFRLPAPATVSNRRFVQPVNRGYVHDINGMPDHFLTTIAVSFCKRPHCINDRPGYIEIMRIDERDSIWRGFKQRSKPGIRFVAAPAPPALCS